MRLLILAAIITLAYGHTACPPLWTAFKGNCYRLFPDRLRHEDAATTCGQFAPCNAAALGQLAKISDVQENEFLKMYVNSFVAAPPSVDIWVGASDAALEGRYTWGDGSALGFTNWDFGPPRQPDNGAASGGQPENCVMFGGERGTWFDASCAMMMPYICMMPAEVERGFFPGRPGIPGQNPGQGGFPGQGGQPGQPAYLWRT